MKMSDLSWLTARPIAHRGLHDMNRSCWENTLCAFSGAIENGYAIECDVHLSADGVPMVFHDDALKRLTGEEGFIHGRSADQLANLSIGGTRDHVPTLREALALVDGRVPLVIELKGSEGHDGALVAEVAKTLEAYRGKAAIMSFEHRLLRDMARLAPSLPRGLTAEGHKGDAIEAHFSMLATGISFVSYHVMELPNPFVTFVRERLSMPVITWTVRTPEAVTLTREQADQMTFEGFRP